MANGWMYGEKRDNEKKIHNCIVDWADLPDEYREYDRATCRQWPARFLAAGLGIARLVQTNSENRKTSRNHLASCSVNRLDDESVEACAREWHRDYVEGFLGAELRRHPDSRIAAFAEWGNLPLFWKEKWWRQVAEIIRILKDQSFHVVKVPESQDVSLVVCSFSDKEFEELASQEHDRWCRERKSDGWTYGPARDDTKKVHDAIVPWADLPEMYKHYDRAFCRTWPTLFSKGGYEIRR